MQKMFTALFLSNKKKFNPRDFFKFEVLHESSKSQARVGRIHTPHGTIETPGYVAVATNAALKGVDFRDAVELIEHGEKFSVV